MDKMENELNDVVEQVCENRRKIIEGLEKHGKKFAVLTRVEFKRAVLNIEGELVNFTSEEVRNLWVRFVTTDRTLKISAQHFKFKGTKFLCTLNMMSADNESPMATGEYQLKIFEKYKTMNDREKSTAHTKYYLSGEGLYKKKLDDEGHCTKKTLLTHEYPAVISDSYKFAEDDTKDNIMNFKLRRSAQNLFYAISATDIDTLEYQLNVTYKEPAPPMTYFRRCKKVLTNRKDLIVRDLYWGKIWTFKKLFKFFSHFAKHNGNIILFASGSRAEIGGNEEFIYKRMLERGLDKEFKFRFDFKASITDRKSIPAMIKFIRYLATSDIILIDDYYPDVYWVDYAKDVKFLQVWHACGAFKSLGFERLGKPGAPPFNTRVHKCYTHVPVSSYHSALHHAEGFGLDESKFYPVGIPRTDIFFDEDYKAKTREKMLEVFAPCKTADTVYMYAPTFRGDNANNARFPFDRLDFNRWGELLEKTNSVLIVKLHPFVKERIDIPEKYKDRILDASDYREVNDILFIVDVLITDYSSIIYEMSLLKKPMVFYAFDQKYYEATRDFFEPYEQLVPGKIVNNFDDLMTALENKDYDYHKMDSFIKKNFTYTDGHATDRVIDQLILGNTEEKGAAK